jgi:hypothetical protein
MSKNESTALSEKGQTNAQTLRATAGANPANRTLQHNHYLVKK